MKFHSPFAIPLAMLFTLSAQAQSYQVQGIHIDQAYARATVAHQPSGGAYVTIENKGATADKLIGASSAVAKSVEIHTMAMDGDVMRMREVGSIALKPSEKVVMQPGRGYHIMLLGLKKPLKAGDKFPLTLSFDKAGKTEVEVVVRDMAAQPLKAGEMHRGH